jgi:uncharacterized protein YgiM (DUF1202 family)
MRSHFGYAASICLILCLLVAGCNLPSAKSGVNAVATGAAATLDALRTAVAATLTAAPPPSTSTLLPAIPAPPTITSTPQNPVVAQLALCWTGPGNAYPVVSSVKVGTSVELMGVGSIAGWYIIKNPTYHDPCWIEGKNLKIDPNFNLSTLKIYNPPPTPGPTETEVPPPTDAT